MVVAAAFLMVGEAPQWQSIRQQRQSQKFRQ
jgi:hypothetical protein